MKSISAAVVIFVGLGWYWLGHAVHPANIPPSQFSDAPWTKFMGVLVTAGGFIGWWYALLKDPPKS